MRLVQFSNDDELSLVEFVGSQIPKYAILSHTWGAVHEEVSFRDLTEGAGKNKIGYHKLTFCAKQAAADGLHFFWVDTCCIDKSSSSELSEAINSMFSWYRKSSVCYAYLTDVDVDEGTAVFSESVSQKLRNSHWFTRGWTLQELLAPRELFFFSNQGVKLGSKKERKTLISEITSIDGRYLERGEAIRTASISERMSWVQDRITTRTEDIAYCLLGIFNIHMALLYGEGLGAFRRLQEKIIEVVNDQTVFCWSHRSPTVPKNWRSILAPHPAAFRGSMKFRRTKSSLADIMPYTLTNAGLSIQIPIVHVHQGIFAVLDVLPDVGDEIARLGIPLRPATDYGNYRRTRIPEDPIRIPVALLRIMSLDSVKKQFPDYPVYDLLFQKSSHLTPQSKEIRTFPLVHREKLFVLFREDENNESSEHEMSRINIGPTVQTRHQEVRFRLHITFDVPAYLSIPSTLKRGQPITGNLRFSRKWSMVEARLKSAGDIGAALIELRSMGLKRPLAPEGRYFCLLNVRAISQEDAYWTIYVFCLLASSDAKTAVKIQCQSSLPEAKPFASAAYSYIQCVSAHDSLCAPIHYIHGVFHIELSRGDWESRKVAVDELLRSISAHPGPEFDLLRHLSDNFGIQKTLGDDIQRQELESGMGHRG